VSAPLPLIDDATREAAVHGSWCPKLCSHACPVLSATGRDDAVPWSLHRTVADLAARHISAASAARQLEACTGCLGCQVPCVFGQDVPAQVRAGRAAVAAAGSPLDARQAAVTAVAAGRSPYHVPTPAVPTASTTPDPVELTVVVGCRDTTEVVAAAAVLYEAAGVCARFVVPDGCCGAILTDLGAPDEAAEAGRSLRDRIGEGPTVVLDPHCLGSTGTREAIHVTTSLAELVDRGDLTFADGDLGPVAYHDPCLLARGPAPVIEPPRRLLAAAGYTVVDPEASARHTGCSGAGLGFDLVDPDAAAAVARRRGTQLDAAAPTAATACSGARRMLSAERGSVHDVLVLLAARLTRTPT